MADSSPAVSVIVCTRDRPAGLARALASVAEQTYDDYELIVVDDGSEPPARAPAIRLDGGGAGAARAAGLAAARGRYTAFCDDDDSWTPEHLEVLVDYLERNPDVGLVYADSVWIDEEGSREVPYSIDYDALILREDNCIFPTDALMRTEVARRAGGFDPTLDACEDWDLWLRLNRLALLRHIPRVLAVRRDGPDTVLWRDDRWVSWQRVFESAWRDFEAMDLAAQHDIELARIPRRAFDRSTWRGERRELIWHSILRPQNSFGAVSRQLLRALERNGVDVRLAPCRTQPAEGLERFHEPHDHWGRFAFYYDYRYRPSVLPSPRRVNYAMWETEQVPAAMVDEINGAVELQYVPSRRVLESFEAAGVVVPMRVLHHGVDAQLFRPIERPEREVFSFGTLGQLSKRKGIDVLIRAFEEEFAPEEPVRLLLRSSQPARDLDIRHPGIELQEAFTAQADLPSVLAEMDAFVLPSRGEPFGLLGLEAMATGLPLIAIDWDGPAEYLDDGDSLRLSYRLLEAGGTYANSLEYHGLWAEPDLAHLRALMRRLYEDPRAGREMGSRAAERVRSEWTWDRPARQIRADLDAIA